MKAKFYKNVKRKFCASHRKEKGGFYQEYAALIPSKWSKQEFQAVVTVRLYWPGQTTCYACAFVTHKKAVLEDGGTCVSGSGSAGGYGYDKPSAAAGEALRNAGFALEKSISGVGESAIREAVLAVAKAAGWPNAKLHTAHA